MLPLPIGDFPNPPRTQWVTRVLIGINVAVFLFISMPLSRPLTQADLQDADVRAAVAEMTQVYGVPVQQMSRYDVFTWQWGYQPGRPSILALFFCMFLHGGFMHLAGNMLYLWIFGDNIEDRMGHGRYIAFYLLCGVAAVFAQVLPEPDARVPMIGASGAISGVLGAYLLFFPHARVLVAVPLGFVIQMIRLPAVWVLGLWFAIQLVSSLLAEQGEGGVAFRAHLGGFIAGLVIGPLMARGRRPA